MQSDVCGSGSKGGAGGEREGAEGVQLTSSAHPANTWRVDTALSGTINSPSLDPASHSVTVSPS